MDKKQPRIQGEKILWSIARVLGLLACLYTFVISLDLMSSAFRLIGGKYASEALQSSVILTNPVAGLMIGILVTVVVQSSSTSTSIVISMVSADILTVKNAIPIIMGANIGTSITGTLVSLTQAANKDVFRRAFTCSTLNDVFNKISVLLLLPLEIVSGYLLFFSGLIVDAIFDKNGNATSSSGEIEILNAITKPISKLIIQLDKEVLNDIAKNVSTENQTLIKHYCPKKVVAFVNETFSNETYTYKDNSRCSFLLEGLDWPEWTVGLLLLFISLFLLCFCLILMVKILTAIFKGSVAKIVQRVVNSDFPGIWRFFNSIVSILLGCGLTIIIQSSSVFISCLVPLVGIGLVEVERVFPLVLGANIGTTITGILAAFSAPSNTLKPSLQIAFCHTLFNITGILIWYPIPFVRKIPLSAAKFLGKICGEYRWFAVVYLILVFLAVPISTFGLSFAGLVPFLCVFLPILACLIFVLLINVAQEKKPEWLPKKIRNWSFMPLPFRSLQPYDKFLTKYICFCACSRNNSSSVSPANDDAKDVIVMQNMTDEEKNGIFDKNEYKN